MTEPLVSFGIPVHNGETHICRLLDSIVAQDTADMEVIISDNASTDRTAEIIREYAARASRIRYFRHEENNGQIANFNNVFELCRGKYFQWIGADDWLEPTYLRKCLRLLEENPRLAGVTTNMVLHHEDDGRSYFVDYRGERLESSEPHRRFVRMLWLLSKGQLYCDPMFTLFRRITLTRTHLFQIVPHTDLVMAAELSLVGPFGHVAEPLFHRLRPAIPPSRRAEYWKRYHPRDPQKVRASIWKACRIIGAGVWSAPLKFRQKLICSWALVKYLIKYSPMEIRQSAKLRLILLLPQGSWFARQLDRGKCAPCEKTAGEPRRERAISRHEAV